MIEVITSVSGQRLLRLYLGFVKVVVILVGIFLILPLLAKSTVNCLISFFSFSNIECFNDDIFAAIGMLIFIFSILKLHKLGQNLKKLIIDHQNKTIYIDKVSYHLSDVYFVREIIISHITVGWIKLKSGESIVFVPKSYISLSPLSYRLNKKDFKNPYIKLIASSC